VRLVWAPPDNIPLLQHSITPIPITPFPILVRLPGIAPGPSTWQEDILLLNDSREIERAGSALALPAHAISTKNKHLLVIYSIPTRGFTADVSVFRGTPPPKPLECKFWLDTIGALLCERWT